MTKKFAFSIVSVTSKLFHLAVVPLFKQMLPLILKDSKFFYQIDSINYFLNAFKHDVVLFKIKLYVQCDHQTKKPEVMTGSLLYK